MKQRASFFNGAIFRADAKRFWWIPALHTLAILLLCLLPLYISYSDSSITFYQAAPYADSLLYRNSAFSYLSLFVFCVGLGVLIFSYLNKKSAVSFLHAAPVTRASLFVTHTLFGVVSLILPILLSGGVLLLFRANPNFAQTILLSHIGTWVLTHLSYAFLGFAFCAFVGMLCGNSVTHFVLTYIFAALPIFFEMIIEALVNILCYGYTPVKEDFATNQFLYFTPEQLMKWQNLGIYLLYTLIFLAIAYVLYRKRHLENCGELICFPRIKAFVLYGASVCTGLLGYFYLNALMGTESVFFMLPFALLGLIICNMLTKKAFTLRGVIKPFVCVFATVCALFCLFFFDLTGFEARVPEIEDIESVYVDTTYAGSRRSPYDSLYTTVPRLTKEQDIENAILFHHHKIANREKADDGTFLYVGYQLKNGKTLTRRYPVHFEQDAEFLKPIMETEENKARRFPILSKKGEDATTAVSICDMRLAEPFKTYFTAHETDGAFADAFIEALKEDLKNVQYEEFIYGTETPTSISIDVALPYELTDEEIAQGIVVDSTISDSHTYYIRSSYKNTLALLDTIGFYDALPTRDNYHSVEVTKVEWGIQGKEVVTTVTAPEKVDTLYLYATAIDTRRGAGENGYIELLFVSDTHHDFSVMFPLDASGFPEGAIHN